MGYIVRRCPDMIKRKGLLHKRMNALIRHAFGVTPSPEIGERLSLGYIQNHLHLRSAMMI